jgi:hypothetical protein
MGCNLKKRNTQQDGAWPYTTNTGMDIVTLISVTELFQTAIINQFGVGWS